MSQNLNSQHMHMHMHMQADDVPPPPYSETDIYSNSGGPRSPNTNTNTTSPDTPSRVSSSTGGDVVYTPPLTPQTLLNTHVQASQQQQPLPTTQPGATLYFESRPPPAAAATGVQRDVVVYSVKVEGTSSPDDFPYQNDWAARDVTSQDWATFVNFLLPDHTTRRNEAVIERKLSAEAGSDASPTSGCFPVEAQLEQVRENQPSTTGTKREIEATIQQWNDGFFGPRGMSLKLDQETGELAPGGWEAEREDDGDRLRQQQQQQQRETYATTTFGRLPIDNDGIRYGDAVVWDNGLKLGSNGIPRARRGCSPERRDGPEDRNAGPSRKAGPEQSASREDFHGPPPGPSWSFGGGSGWHRDRNGHRSDRRDMHHGQHDRHDRERHGRRGHWGGRHSADGGGRRGRHSRRDEKHNHDRSSSESSVSSDDSSSSESSIGSLPSYDDIKDHQLPLYTERLRDWTSNPDQMRTKSDVKALRADLQSTRSMPEDAHLDQSLDRTVLQVQIKGLHAQWKSIKKAQRQTRRRERRQRRAERREQRHQKREMRRAYKDSARGPWGPSFGMPVPSIPAVPPVPSTTSAPPAPPAPTAAPAPPPWSQGFVRGRNGPSQGSSFFFGPDGPLGERGPFGSHGPLLGMDGPLARHGPLGEHGPLGPHDPFGPGGGSSWGSRGRGRGDPFGGRGASFGAGRGRGNPRDRAPGAWPEDDGQETGVITAPPPGPAPTAKYKAAEQIEAEVGEMVSQAADLGDGVERRALEKAIEALTDNLDMLRMEADEAYARELAASEAGY